MTYARIEQNKVTEYPVYEGDIRLQFPNVSFATPFQPPEDYVEITDVEPPVYDYTKNLDEGYPVLSNGNWTRNWIVTDANESEINERIESKWTYVRADRNKRLADCDWTQLSDAPVDAAAWALYRQALRDITEQSDPFNIDWPVTP